MLLPILPEPGLACVDGELRPRFWATAWVGGLGPVGRSRGSLRQHVRNLNRFYGFCDERFGRDALDSSLADRNAVAVQDMTEAFYLDITKSVSYNSGAVQCWGTVCAFVRFFCKRYGPGDEAWHAFDAYLEALRTLRAPRKGRFKYIRALPEPTMRELLAVSTPGSDRNPFRAVPTQWRNWLLVNVLLLAGLRRGEVLLLKITSLQSEVEVSTGALVHWLNVTTTTDQEDERSTRPSIKTLESHRQVPVSASLAALYEHYVAEARADSQDHDFLFTSRSGAPLSVESVTKVLQALSSSISVDAAKRFKDSSGGKRHISPHDLRHTCATARYRMFLKKDRDRELTLQRMRAFFGWSRESTMPDVYARAAIQDDLLVSWSELFDARVEHLRALA